MLLNKEQANMRNAFYFSGFSKDPYKLLGFLPLLTDCFNYYAMVSDKKLDKSIVEDFMNKNLWKDYNRNEISHVSPVFGGYDPEFQTESEYYAAQEQEWSEKGLPHKKSFSFSEDRRQAILKNRTENTYILFFHGCDDGHMALRFKNERDAFDYLAIVESFEDITENEELIYLN